MGGKQIAAKLDISLSRLARVFKAQLGMSLVEYRNRLRLERFSALMAQGHTNLLAAALAAGFGSYAQFHRVFAPYARRRPATTCERRAPRERLSRPSKSSAPVDVDVHVDVHEDEDGIRDALYSLGSGVDNNVWWRAARSASCCFERVCR